MIDAYLLLGRGLFLFMLISMAVCLVILVLYPIYAVWSVFLRGLLR